MEILVYKKGFPKIKEDHTVKDLPEGSYHDTMPSLDEKGQYRAARIALRKETCGSWRDATSA